MAERRENENGDDIRSSDDDDVASTSSSNFRDNDASRRLASELLTPYVCLPPLVPFVHGDRYRSRDLEDVSYSRQLIDIENQRRTEASNNQLMLRDAENDMMNSIKMNRLSLATQTDENKRSLNEERSIRLREFQVNDSFRTNVLVKSEKRIQELNYKEGLVHNTFVEDRLRRRDEQKALEQKYRDEQQNQLKLQAYRAEQQLNDLQQRNVICATDAERQISIHLRGQDERNQQQIELRANNRREDDLAFIQRQDMYQNLQRTKTDAEHERLRNSEINLRNQEMIKSDGVRERESTYLNAVRDRHNIRQSTSVLKNLYEK